MKNKPKRENRKKLLSGKNVSNSLAQHHKNIILKGVVTMLGKYETVRARLETIERRRNELKKKLAAIRFNESTHGQVVNAAIGLIKEHERPIRNREIVERLNGEKLGESNPLNRPFLVSAILSQEINKKSARLKRVDRGLYDLK